MGKGNPTIELYGKEGDNENLWGYKIILTCGTLFRKNFVQYIDNHYVIQEGTGPGFSITVGVADNPKEADVEAHKHITKLASKDLEGKVLDKTKYGDRNNINLN